MKKQIFLIFSLFIIHFSLFAQTSSITNIQVSQRTDGSGNVDIYYDLAGPGSSYFVSLEVSFNNGSTFTPVSSTFLSGNTGVSPGTVRHLIWNGKGSNNNTYCTETKVKLIATTTPPAGIPCPGTPTVVYNGQTYNTVQIGTQCWFKENLNIGTRINGSQEQTNNSVIEKYCYNDLESNCDIYGGLYQWNEMMQYVTTEGTQGICPTGWHVTTDGEWCTVTQYLDPTVNCGATGWSGTNAGGKMKEAGTSHWASPNTGATNSSGFTALPGGGRYGGGNFSNLTSDAYFWSSSQNGAIYAWYRGLHHGSESVDRYYVSKPAGYSGRCVQN